MVTKLLKMTTNMITIVFPVIENFNKKKKINNKGALSADWQEFAGMSDSI